MSKRLDEIKARLNEVGSHHPDVVTLLAAVEAVLALHKPSLGLHRATNPTVEFCRECGLAYPCETVTAIRTALGEDA